MRRRIYLYIGDELADLADDSFVLLNFTREEMTAPQAVRNSWTQSITLPKTENNNAILGHYYRLDRRTIGSGGTGTNFAALKRSPFRLFGDDGTIIMRGYIKLNGVKDDGYDVALFGGLGQFFYDLTYDGAGNRLTLADCPFRVNTTWYASDEIYIRCWRSGINAAWNAFRFDAPSSGSAYDIINFAPCLNGTQYPFKFDTNKAAYRCTSSPSTKYPNLYTEADEGGKHYDAPNAGSTILLQFGQKHNEWEVQDLRSYCQRPIISLRMIMEGVRKYATAAGYTLLYDIAWFNDENIFLQRCWVTLPFLNRDEMDDVALQMATVADFLGGTKSPAEYLVAIAKTFGFVFESSPDGQTIQMRQRQSFYNGTRIDLSDRVDVPSIELRPYEIDARFYDWEAKMAGAFCANYEAKYGRKYGSLRLDTGYDFDGNTKDVTASLPWIGCADVVDISENYQVITGSADPDYGTATNYLCKFAFTDSVKWNLVYTDQDTGNDEIKSFEPLPLPNYGGMNYKSGGGNAGRMWLPLPQLTDEGGKALTEGGVLLFYEGQSNTPAITAGGLAITSVDFHLSDDTAEMLALNGGVPCWDITTPNGGGNTTAISWIPSFRRWHFNGATMQLSLDWGDPLEVPYTGDTFRAGCGLYPSYWEAYMADRLDDDTAVMRAKVDLRGWQISDALFRNFYYYDGALWALNKIINHSVTTDALTECEFVKVQAVAAYASGQLTF